MLLPYARRLLRETDKRVLWALVYHFAFKGFIATERFKRRRKRGVQFPPFLFLSLTNRCNLLCQGCWVHSAERPLDMAPADVDRIITAAKTRGVRFFGILGGEPMLHAELLDILGRHRDCYFQVFTNGTLIDADNARQMGQLANITPLISIEGLEATSDERRKGREVYERTMEGLARCRENRLFFGVATSVCQSNYGELATEAFVRDVIARGAHYLWYYIYRPVGADPSPELALDRDQVLGLRPFLVQARLWAPILLLDTYWDHAGVGLCPAAVGLSYHINAGGDVEPCPPLQFAEENLLADDGGDMAQKIEDSAFLREFSQLATERSRGCILMEDPAALRAFLVRRQSRDTSGRDGLAELAAMAQRPSHDMGDDAIPEASWVYRFAKKHWFFGFGAYG